MLLNSKCRQNLFVFDPFFPFQILSKHQIFKYRSIIIITNLLAPILVSSFKAKNGNFNHYVIEEYNIIPVCIQFSEVYGAHSPIKSECKRNIFHLLIFLILLWNVWFGAGLCIMLCIVHKPPYSIYPISYTWFAFNNYCCFAWVRFPIDSYSQAKSLSSNGIWKVHFGTRIITLNLFLLQINST